MDPACFMNDTIKTIGLISDTHGLLRNSAVDALSGVDMILHAGDIDRMIVIDELELTAPVRAVRGNMDFKPEVRALPDYLEVNTWERTIGVIHNRYHLGADPAARGLSVVVHGHTHMPAIDETGGVLFVNPGSAGPARPNRPVSVGILKLKNGNVVPEIITIES